MATLTPTLTLASSDIFADQPLALTVTDSLTVQAPMTDISRMNTDDNIGNGAGIILAEATTDVYYIYIKHTGINSDGVSTSTSSDYITLSNADGESPWGRLYPGEFLFYAQNPYDGSDGGDGATDQGGLKITAASTAVQVNYGFWKRTS